MDTPLEHLNHEAPSVSESAHEQQTSESQPAQMPEISESSDAINPVADSTNEGGENIETESNKKNESKSKHALSPSGHAGSAAPIGPGEDTSIASVDNTPAIRGGSIPITGANSNLAPSSDVDCADCTDCTDCTDCADCGLGCCAVSCACLCLPIACIYDIFWAIVCCPIRLTLLCCLSCCDDSP